MDTRPETAAGPALRGRLAAALPAAMKARDRTSVAALRSVLGALDNAEAVPAPRDPAQAGTTHLGAGSTEVRRRGLSDLEILALVATEAEQREQAARTYDGLGDAARAERLRAEAEVIRAFLG